MPLNLGDSGNYAFVRVGFHRETKLEVAVKVIDKTKYLGREKARFQRNIRREIDILKSVSHVYMDLPPRTEFM